MALEEDISLSSVYERYVEAIGDFDDLYKLGQGFTLADPLEKLDLGDGAIPRPVFVNQFDYQLSIKPI